MPDIFKAWPNRGKALSQDEVIDLYENGFAGALPPTPEVEEAFAQMVDETGGLLFGSDVARASGFEDSHAGKLVAHFQHVEKMYPGCWPGPAQQRGDCVSHGSKNAALYSHVCDVVSGQPDQKTGKVEAPVEIAQEGVKQGVFSTEAFYWYRRHGGDGWYCAAAGAVAVKEAGCVIRKSYPDINLDLTRYSSALAGKWGRSLPPANVQEATRQNLIHTATKLRSFEEVRDFLGNGYGINGCGSEGFTSARDENGVSGRRGSWAHSMAVIGADDRPEIHQKYGGPLILILNSWGIWNQGPRKILGTDIEIPQGSFWARWQDCSRREHIAYSGVSGWPARSLPDYDPGH